MSKLGELIEAIKAISQDIEANVSMPNHNTELYAKPMSILPEHCPLLTIWPERSPWQLIATPSTYTVRPQLYVGWYIAAPEEIEQAGEGLGDIVLGCYQTADLIVDRLVSYSEGVPTRTGTYAVIKETVPERQGLVWGLSHLLEVER